MTRFREAVEARLEDSELSVEDLAADMNLSRVQLYRKVKSLTGSTPVELLRTARLKRAYQLLLTTDKSVSEVLHTCRVVAHCSSEACLPATAHYGQECQRGSLPSRFYSSQLLHQVLQGRVRQATGRVKELTLQAPLSEARHPRMERHDVGENTGVQLLSHAGKIESLVG